MERRQKTSGEKKTKKQVVKRKQKLVVKKKINTRGETDLWWKRAKHTWIHCKKRLFLKKKWKEKHVDKKNSEKKLMFWETKKTVEKNNKNQFEKLLKNFWKKNLFASLLTKKERPIEKTTSRLKKQKADWRKKKGPIEKNKTRLKKKETWLKKKDEGPLKKDNVDWKGQGPLNKTR